MTRTSIVSVALLSATLTGCGSDDGKGSASTRCVILANGAKLCGEDAKAYCNRFDAPDVRSQLACDTVTGRSSKPRRKSKNQLADEATARGSADVRRTVIPALEPIAKRYLGRKFDAFVVTGLGGLQLITKYPPGQLKRTAKIDALCKALERKGDMNLDITEQGWRRALGDV